MYSGQSQSTSLLPSVPLKALCAPQPGQLAPHNIPAALAPPAASPATPHFSSPPSIGPFAVQQIMQQQQQQQQFSNKVLCQQMVYNAALLSTALNQRNPGLTPGAPTYLFASQPAVMASSWPSAVDNHNTVAIIEEVTDHKNIYTN